MPPAASEDTISKLQKLVITSKDVGKLFRPIFTVPLLLVDMDFPDFTLDQLQACAVCKEDYIPKEEALRLPCKHIFHEECIVPWLKMNHTCPVW